MKEIEIHQLDFAPVIAHFHANERLAKMCISFLNADLCRADNVLVSPQALLNRNFYYLVGLEKKKKKLVVELAENPIDNDSEFVKRILEVDAAKHVDNKFRFDFEGRSKRNRH